MEFLGHINFRQASGRHGAELDGALGRFKARFKPRVWADSNGSQHGRCCRHDRVVRDHDLCGSQRRQMQRFGIWKAVDGRIGCGCQPVDQLKKGRVFNDTRLGQELGTERRTLRIALQALTEHQELLPVWLG